MVRYYDESGVFDATIEKVWKLIDAHQDHTPKIHPGVKKVKVVETGPNFVVRDLTTTGPDGRDTTSRLRTTRNPPTSLTLEWLDGAVKGSWATFVYRPEGNRTRVVGVGELRMEGMDDASTLKILREFLDNGFQEDAAYLPKVK